MPTKQDCQDAKYRDMNDDDILIISDNNINYCFSRDELSQLSPDQLKTNPQNDNKPWPNQNIPPLIQKFINNSLSLFQLLLLQNDYLTSKFLDSIKDFPTLLKHISLPGEPVQGRNALMYAAKYPAIFINIANRIPLTEFANVMNLKDKNGNTVTDYAQSNGELVNYINQKIQQITNLNQQNAQRVNKPSPPPPSTNDEYNNSGNNGHLFNKNSLFNGRTLRW